MHAVFVFLSIYYCMFVCLQRFGVYGWAEEVALEPSMADGSDI